MLGDEDNQAEDDSNKEIRFAVLGRQLADNYRSGKPMDVIIAEVTLMRRQEQDSAAKLIQFAALARQVGDAARSGRDVAPLLDRLAELRRIELG